MSNLIELAFEGVPSARLNDFIGVLVNDSSVLSVDVSEVDGVLAKWDGDVEKIMSAISSASAMVSLNLDRVDWPQLAILRTHLQVVRYDGRYDVMLSFTDNDISCKGSVAPIEALHACAVEFLTTSGGENVYCGYEPAHDKKTRFFTNNCKGPLLDFW